MIVPLNLKTNLPPADSRGLTLLEGCKGKGVLQGAVRGATDFQPIRAVKQRCYFLVILQRVSVL